MSHLAERLSSIDIRVDDPRKKTFQKKITFTEDSCDSEKEAEIVLAERTKDKLVLCLFAKKDIEKYEFDATKVDRIFDLLLQEEQIKLSPNHTIPSAEELKNRKYYKWHNVVSYNTNECIVFCQEIQSAIEKGRIRFANHANPMKIDGHPFPMKNMVEVNNTNAKVKSKVLTFEWAKQI